MVVTTVVKNCVSVDEATSVCVFVIVARLVWVEVPVIVTSDLAVMTVVTVVVLSQT